MLTSPYANLDELEQAIRDYFHYYINERTKKKTKRTDPRWNIGINP
ncbi:IS3 family transposase [uncultured Lactobacillus sp.]